jgi:hypothetical protein
VLKKKILAQFENLTLLKKKLISISNSNLILKFEIDFQNPQIFQQTISRFPEHSTLVESSIAACSYLHEVVQYSL